MSMAGDKFNWQEENGDNEMTTRVNPNMRDESCRCTDTDYCRNCCKHHTRCDRERAIKQHYAKETR